MPNPNTSNVQRIDSTAGTNLGGGGGLRRGGAGNGQGGTTGGSNSRGQGSTGNDRKPSSRRKTMLTADETVYMPAEIDPETGEVTRFDSNPKKRKRTVLDVEGTPTLDELRAASKSLLGY
jgi:hypothetical protein